MPEQLKPCPICGAMPKLSTIVEKDGDILPGRLVPEGGIFHSGKYMCSECGVHISVGDWKDTEEECAEEWNKRVARYEREQEPDFCSYCEESSDGFIHNVCFEHEDKGISFSVFDGEMRTEFVGFDSIGIKTGSRFVFPISFCPFCGKEFDNVKAD